MTRQSGPSTPIIGHDGSAFRTAETAAWPTLLCDFLAELAAEASFGHHDVQQAGGVSPMAAPEPAIPQDPRVQQVIKATMANKVGWMPPPPNTLAPTATALTIGDDVNAALAARARPPIRRSITVEEFEALARGEAIGEGLCYIGRGGRGVPPSRWGNPFRVGFKYQVQQSLF